MATLHDLIEINKLGNLSVVAGQGGINRLVESCAILDYEFDPGVKNQFRLNNFQKNQLVFSTFLYAKSCPALIMDAVRRLVSIGTSGLIIKNIFRLQLPEAVIRYADAMNYPIFILNDSLIPITQYILGITDGLRQLTERDIGETLIENTLNGLLGPDAVTKKAYELFPAIKHYYFSMYLYDTLPLTLERYDTLYERFSAMDLGNWNNIVYRYRNGVIALFSMDTYVREDAYSKMVSIANTVNPVEPYFSVGISLVMYTPTDMKEALNESISAALCASIDSDGSLVLYSNIGLYKFVVPYITESDKQQYRLHVLDPLIHYDAENHSNLFDTLISYIANNGSIKRFAQTTGLHENTLRYKISKIAELTGLDCRDPEHYAILTFALKLHLFGAAYNEFLSRSPSS